MLRVLVVEDIQTDRLIAKRKLKKYFHTTTLSSASEAKAVMIPHDLIFYTYVNRYDHIVSMKITSPLKMPSYFKRNLALKFFSLILSSINRYRFTA